VVEEEVYLFWWHGKWKIESNTAGYRLVKQIIRPKVGAHTLLSVLPRSYKCSTYTTDGNQWSCDNQKSVG
jgi:hypothetical protein